MLFGCKAIAYCRFKDIQIDVFRRFEFNTIPAHIGFADPITISFAEVCLIVEAKNVNRNAGGVCAEADPVKFFGLPVGVFYCV